MSPKKKVSYLLASVKFDYNISMLEDLKKELPYLLKQYSKKKQKLSKKVFDGLDEETKSEFNSIFSSVEEMQNLSKNLKDGEFLSPRKFSESESDIVARILLTLPRIYVFDGLVREMFLVYLITLFESYLENILRITFEKRPECLSSSKTITFEEVVANLKSNEVLNALIEKEIKEVLGKDIEKINEYFQNKFKITISEFVSDWNEFKERFYRRNILSHNLGVINEKYRSKTGYKGKDKRLTVSEDYLDKSFELFSLMNRKIMGAFYGKFEKV